MSRKTDTATIASATDKDCSICSIWETVMVANPNALPIGNYIKIEFMPYESK